MPSPPIAPVVEETGSPALRTGLCSPNSAIPEKAMPRQTSSVWLPIASAPKDGTKILAFAPNHYDGPTWRVTWWRREGDASYIGWGEFNMQHWPPTHWQPLTIPGDKA